MEKNYSTLQQLAKAANIQRDLRFVEENVKLSTGKVVTISLRMNSHCTHVNKLDGRGESYQGMVDAKEQNPYTQAAQAYFMEHFDFVAEKISERAAERMENAEKELQESMAAYKTFMSTFAQLLKD